MKSKLRLMLTAVILFLIPNINFGQTAPTLGTTSSFALFTAGGAFSVTGASSVTGNVGTHVGAFTGFPPGSLVGQIHVADPASAQASIDVAVAYSELTQGGTVIGVGLGNDQILLPGVYQTGAASTLNGNLTLDGGGNPNALFIIRIGGALATGASSTVTLTNSASLCNVYWQIGGQFDLETGSVFRGTLVVDGPIHLLGSSSLLGRGLSTAGSISLSNNTVTNSCACVAPAAPTASVTTQPTVIVSTGTISVTAPANGSGILYTVTGITPVVAPVTNVTGLFTGLTPGIYNVTTTNAAYVSTATPLTVNAVPGAPAAPTASVTTQPTCIVSTGTITITAPASGSGISYTVTGITPVVAPVTNATGLFTGLIPGIYNVTTTNAACVSTATPLTVNAVSGAPSAPKLISVTQPTCIVPTGSKVLNGLPATGTWTLNPGGITGTGTSTTISGLAPGTYSYTVTNAEGCTSVSSASFVITALPATPSAPKLISVIQPTCVVPTGSKVLNGLPATGTWTLNPGGITGTGTSTTISGLAPGTYSYTVTNAEGCTSVSSASFVITALTATPSAPKLVSVTQPTCEVSTGSKVLNGLPATGTWTLNPGGITGTGTSTTLSGLAPGTYSYTVTNADGCTSVSSASFVIAAQPPIPAAPTVTLIQTTCELVTGTIIVTSPKGIGMTYSIDGSTYTNTTGIFTLLPAGTYIVTAKSADGCISSR